MSGSHVLRLRPTAVRRSPGRVTSLVLDAVLAVTGAAGGIWMITHPTTILEPRLLEGTPFTDWQVPGIALLLVNGVWPAVALILTLRRHRLAAVAQQAVGYSLLLWLMIQIPLVGYAVQLQVPLTALALTLILLNQEPARSESRRRL